MHCPLDHSVAAWTERNLGLHCESIGDMAAAQETMAAALTYPYAGNIPIGEELFRQAARLNTRRAQYQLDIYTNPYQKDEGTVSAIKGNFERQPRDACAAAQET